MNATANKTMNRTNTESNAKKSQIGYSRLLDNHFDATVHHKPWIAPGKQPESKFDHDDSGLGFRIVKPYKLRNFKEKYEIDEELKKNYSNHFRNFKEYENLRNNEILLTIEYCTNCKQHQSSTKHDEEKYYNFAVSVKQQVLGQFPIVKVLLKPLLFNPTDESIESLHLRKRIGAFEVQIVSKNSQGEITSDILHSKLQSRCWPDVAGVVEKVSNFVPKEDFSVRLVDRNYKTQVYDSQREGEPEHPKKKDSKLIGIKLRLTPHRINRATGTDTERSLDIRGASFMTGGRPTSGQSMRPISGQSQRPQSAQQRPKSAYSSISAKSHGSLGRSVGESADLRRPISAKARRQYTLETDADGAAVFKGIPHDIYELEVIENKNYLPERRLINFFERAENGIPFSEVIELREQTLAFCIIKVVEKGPYELPVSGVEIQIRKRETKSETKTVVLREKDPVSKPGHYEFLIDPGEYVVIAIKEGYEESREEVIAEKGENLITCAINPLNPNIPLKTLIGTTAQVVQQRQDDHDGSKRPERPGEKGYSKAPSQTNSNGPTQNPYQQKGAQQQPKDQAQKKERAQSAQQKNIELFVYDADTRNPIANAQVTVEEINLRLLTDKEGRCAFPVNRLSKGILTISMDNYFEISEEYGPDTLDIQFLNKMKFPLIKRPGHDEYHFRFLTDHEDEEFIKLDAITNDKQGENLKIEKKQNFLGLKNVAQRSGIYRIVATISNPELFLNPENKFIISGPEDYGMIDIPLLPEDLLASKVVYWDIVFISAPDLRLVEINAYSTVMPKVTDYIKQYQSLLKFLHNSKSVDIKGILGFNSKERELAEGDIFVPLKTILSSLDKYGFEIEDKRGLSHLLQSARVPGEMYSYGVLARKFSEIQPPFNFIPDEPKNEVVNEDEDEYLDNFEDDGQ